MEYEVYPDLMASPDLQEFEFKSIGKHGIVVKKIVLIPTGISNIYNLALGDIDENGELNYYSVSYNDDRNKILATIVRAIDVYTTTYPDRLIYFSGSTKERTRLYRIVIGLNLEELHQKFEILAQIENQVEYVTFEKNMPVKGFLIKRKNL
jgi:hypothetical protein